MTQSIHPTAIIMPKAKIGNGSTIGAFSIIGNSARIGANCQIGSHCEIGVDSGVNADAPINIGENSLIRSGSIFYQGSSFGAGLSTGHRVTVREGVKAGLGLQIGTLSDIQGNCVFGDYVRLHSNVHIGQKSKIGNFVWIFPYVVLTNDPTPPSEQLEGCSVDDFAAIATMTTVLPGKKIGRGALIGAMTLVRDDVPNDAVCIGVPGKVVSDTSRITFRKTGKRVYPWRRHFHRGYPEAIVQRWKDEFPEQ